MLIGKSDPYIPDAPREETHMSITEAITCDVCGIKKGVANHWMLWHPHDAIPGHDGHIGGIQFAPWHPDLYRAHRHLCGEACAARLLARSIDEWRELYEAARAPAPHHHPINIQ